MSPLHSQFLCNIPQFQNKKGRVINPNAQILQHRQSKILRKTVGLGHSRLTDASKFKTPEASNNQTDDRHNSNLLPSSKKNKKNRIFTI